MSRIWKLLLSCILLQALYKFGSKGETEVTPVQRFDGWYNNLNNPDWGSIGQGLSRKTYATDDQDAVILGSDSLPNARIISRTFFRGPPRNPESNSDRTVFFAYFGQHLSDDLADSRRIRCPPEYSNVVIPRNESMATRRLDERDRILPIYRNAFLSDVGTSTNLPRSLINQATSWLDGSVIYGNTGSWDQILRSYEDGMLRSEPSNPEFPERNRNELPLLNPIVDRTQPIEARDPTDSFSFGNPRGNENPFLMSLGILWFRYHNRLAARFKDENPDWEDEQIFTEARKWTVATYQSIALYEWLPKMIGSNLTTYEKYNPNLNPSITSEFALAAMRIGHSLVPSGVVLREDNCEEIDPLPSDYGPSEGEPALRLCNTYWQLQNALQVEGILDSIVRGMLFQRAEEDDNLVVEDLSEYLYGPLLRSRMDLETLTIERGRDAGLPSYNSARIAYKLEPISDFSDLSNEFASDLKNLYKQVDRIELYVGGALESRNGGTGELFSAIIKEQFRRIRDSDRFWFENTENNLFTEAEIETILRTTMKDVIMNVTGITPSKIQPNVFTATTEGNSCPIISGNVTFLKSCTPNELVDLFEGWWGPFIGILILVLSFPTGAFIAMRLLAYLRQKEANTIKQQLEKKTIKKASTRKKTGKAPGLNEAFPALEIESKEKSRRVVVVLDHKQIQLLSVSGTALRTINCASFEKSNLFISTNKLVIKVPKEYDVVLQFIGIEERDAAVQMLKDFMSGIPTEVFKMDDKALLKEAITKEARQQLLEAFFRRVFYQALNLEKAPEPDGRARTMDILSLEISEAELAETMGMKKDSLFVKQIFQLADKDESGYLSFKEFRDLIAILMKGTPEAKAKMLFDMYDVDKTGEISREQARAMFRSFLEIAGVKMNAEELEVAVETIFRETGVENKPGLSLEDFQYVMLKEHRESFEQAQLSLPGITKSVRRKVKKATEKAKPRLQRQTTHLTVSSSDSDSDGEERESPSTLRKRAKSRDQRARASTDAVFSEAVALTEEKSRLNRWWKTVKRIAENYRRHILCMLIFYSISIALMVERAIYYAFGSENLGVRRVTEWGIIISRSTAAGISFHFSFILLTMSRNLITFCRETFLKNYIPFDSAVAFHKQIAIVALIESLLHTFGHLVNFYHISIHPLPIVACLFPNIIVDDGSDLPPSIATWLFATITGLTGLLILLTLSIIYIFAMQFSRRFCFRAFWITHHLYSILYVLIILHGSMGLVQAPRYHLFLMVPLGIYVVDKLITLSRSKTQIAVVKADPLPSSVLNLVFQRPTAFDYKSGQWVRIACLPLGANEYHPFTLTSAPHERHLSLHIRAAGPWTTNLRLTYQSVLEAGDKLPLLYLDGPFGEGHQDWYKYEVSVLVGAGIGVTPFASILKDIVNRSNSKKGFQVTCKKVYFLWVTRTQKHFEWLTDIIKDLEETKGGDLVSTQIYITQFSNRFDLRTTMLYICERYFHRVANKSMFTGLKATTHFGRPQFEQFLDSLQIKHSDVRTVGVFSCGPPGLTNGVEAACRSLNKLNKARFNHFFENF